MALDYPIEKDIRFQQGVAKGMEEGMEEGMEKGIEEGIEKGTADERVKIATGMLQEGLSVQLISKLTRLSVEDLEALQKGL